MKKNAEPFMNEERSPLLWDDNPPGLYIGSAGHIRQARGTLPEAFETYYIGVIFLVSGSIAIQARDTDHLLKEQTCCLIDHENRITVDIRSDSGEFLFFSIDGDESKGLLQKNDLWEGVFYSGPPPFGNIEAIMARMPKDSKKNARVNLVSGLDLLRAVQKTNRNSAQHRIAVDAETLIRREWHDPLFSIDSLYEQLHVTRASLSTQFKAAKGKTMLEYLHDIRIKAAIRRLQSTTLNISEIAYACGFSDAAYFSRFIKKKTGKAPMAFRQV